MRQNGYPARGPIAGRTSSDVAAIAEFVEGLEAAADEAAKRTYKTLAAGAITAVAVSAYRARGK